MHIYEDTLEIYFDDLSENAQKEFIKIYGDNGNYDITPLAKIPISDSDDEHSSKVVMCVIEED